MDGPLRNNFINIAALGYMLLNCRCPMDWQAAICLWTLTINVEISDAPMPLAIPKRPRVGFILGMSPANDINGLSHAELKSLAIAQGTDCR